MNIMHAVCEVPKYIMVMTVLFRLLLGGHYYRRRVNGYGVDRGTAEGD